MLLMGGGVHLILAHFAVLIYGTIIPTHSVPAMIYLDYIMLEQEVQYLVVVSQGDCI